KPLDRREFLAGTAGLVAGAAIGAEASMQTPRKGPTEPDLRYTLVDDPLGKALKTPNGRTAWVYMTKRPNNPNFWANSTCCFHPLMTPAGERLTDFAPGDHHHHRG